MRAVGAAAAAGTGVAPGAPVRIGLVGSAATESASASLAATTMGATLGGAGYNQGVFAVAFMAMMGADSVAYHEANVSLRADDHPGEALDRRHPR